jgi:hypothetical protein
MRSIDQSKQTCSIRNSRSRLGGFQENIIDLSVRAISLYPSEALCCYALTVSVPMGYAIDYESLPLEQKVLTGHRPHHLDVRCWLGWSQSSVIGEHLC